MHVSKGEDVQIETNVYEARRAHEKAKPSAINSVEPACAIVYQ